MYLNTRFTMIIIAVFSIFIVISSFSLQTIAHKETIPTLETTTSFEDLGQFPTFPLQCPETLRISDGPTWRTITIGESSLEDVENVYGIRFTMEDQPPWVTDEFVPTFSVLLTSEGAERWKLPQSAHLCMIDGTIMALTLSLGADSEFPDAGIREWLNLYGEPELVTWPATGNDWCWREVVWPQEGLAISVDVSSVLDHPEAALVNSVTLFPYAQGKDYLSHWPYTMLNRTPPTSNNVECPVEENPFDFEAMLELTPEAQ